MPNGRCTNCVAFNSECTHHHTSHVCLPPLSSARHQLSFQRLTETIYKPKPSATRGLQKGGGSFDQRRAEMKPVLEGDIGADLPSAQ
ncbi:hypothetical protein BKA70DRAFT_755293 [Coprinopsis sp. MPI-PUGE-AT-0042]|nr:hypothetical protein BKA70DRAFT_755293 [Coprinopsis sp. MPI-PUGE-AT-0042]